METKTLTPEELQIIKDLNNERNTLINQFGALEFEIQSLELQKEKLIEILQKLSEASEEIGVKLQNKYGEGNVNIDTGEFIPR